MVFVGLFWCFLSFLAGAFTVLGALLWWLNQKDDDKLADKPMISHIELPANLAMHLSAFNDENRDHSCLTESCNGLSFLLQFFFQEKQHDPGILRWLSNTLTLEFGELLKHKALSKIMRSMQIRDLSLGNNFPVIKTLTIENVVTNPDTKMIDLTELSLEVCYTGGLQLAVDAITKFSKTASIKVKVLQISGKGRLQFSRNPFTHWSFSFYEEPQSKFEVESSVLGRHIPRFRAIIVSQLRSLLRRRHTLPYYKLRSRPLVLPGPVAASWRAAASGQIVPCLNSPVLEEDGCSVPAGKLIVSVLQCTRLQEALLTGEGSSIYCSVVVSSMPLVCAWDASHSCQDLDTVSDFYEPSSNETGVHQIHQYAVMELLVRKPVNTSVGIQLKDSVDNLPVVDSVKTSSPGAAAGVLPGDVLLAVGDIMITSSIQGTRLLTLANGKSASFRSSRNSSLVGRGKSLSTSNLDSLGSSASVSVNSGAGENKATEQLLLRVRRCLGTDTRKDAVRSDAEFGSISSLTSVTSSWCLVDYSAPRPSNVPFLRRSLDRPSTPCVDPSPKDSSCLQQLPSESLLTTNTVAAPFMSHYLVCSNASCLRSLYKCNKADCTSTCNSHNNTSISTSINSSLLNCKIHPIPASSTFTSNSHSFACKENSSLISGEHHCLCPRHSEHELSIANYERQFFSSDVVAKHLFLPHHQQPVETSGCSVLPSCTSAVSQCNRTAPVSPCTENLIEHVSLDNDCKSSYIHDVISGVNEGLIASSAVSVIRETLSKSGVIKDNVSSRVGEILGGLSEGINDVMAKSSSLKEKISPTFIKRSTAQREANSKELLPYYCDSRFPSLRGLGIISLKNQYHKLTSQSVGKHVAPKSANNVDLNYLTTDEESAAKNISNRLEFEKYDNPVLSDSAQNTIPNRFSCSFLRHVNDQLNEKLDEKASERNVIDDYPVLQSDDIIVSEVLPEVISKFNECCARNEELGKLQCERGETDLWSDALEFGQLSDIVPVGQLEVEEVDQLAHVLEIDQSANERVAGKLPKVEIAGHFPYYSNELHQGESAEQVSHFTCLDKEEQLTSVKGVSYLVTVLENHSNEYDRHLTNVEVEDELENGDGMCSKEGGPMSEKKRDQLSCEEKVDQITNEVEHVQSPKKKEDDGKLLNEEDTDEVVIPNTSCAKKCPETIPEMAPNLRTFELQGNQDITNNLCRKPIFIDMSKIRRDHYYELENAASFQNQDTEMEKKNLKGGFSKSVISEAETLEEDSDSSESLEVSLPPSDGDVTALHLKPKVLKSDPIDDEGKSVCTKSADPLCGDTSVNEKFELPLLPAQQLPIAVGSATGVAVAAATSAIQVQRSTSTPAVGSTNEGVASHHRPQSWQQQASCSSSVKSQSSGREALEDVTSRKGRCSTKISQGNRRRNPLRIDITPHTEKSCKNPSFDGNIFEYVLQEEHKFLNISVWCRRCVAAESPTCAAAESEISGKAAHSELRQRPAASDSGKKLRRSNGSGSGSKKPATNAVAKNSIYSGQAWCGLPPSKLLGYASLPLISVVSETTINTRGHVVKVVPLRPPDPSCPEAEVYKLGGHKGFEPSLCYGDVTLSIIYQPSDRCENAKSRGSTHIPRSQSDEESNSDGAASDEESAPDALDPADSSNFRHEFKRTHFNSATTCDFCKKKIWLKEACQCSVCGIICHKKCVSRCELESACVGSIALNEEKPTDRWYVGDAPPTIRCETPEIVMTVESSNSELFERDASPFRKGSPPPSTPQRIMCQQSKRQQLRRRVVSRVTRQLDRFKNSSSPLLRKSRWTSEPELSYEYECVEMQEPSIDEALEPGSNLYILKGELKEQAEHSSTLSPKNFDHQLQHCRSHGDVISDHDFEVLEDNCSSVDVPEGSHSPSGQFTRARLSSDDSIVELSRRSRFRREFGRSIRPNHSFLHSSSIESSHSNGDASARVSYRHPIASQTSSSSLESRSNHWYHHTGDQNYRRTLSNFLASMKPGSSSFLQPSHAPLGCPKNNLSSTLRCEPWGIVKRAGSASNISILMQSDSEEKAHVDPFNTLTGSKLRNPASFHSSSMKKAVSVSSIAAAANGMAGFTDNSTTSLPSSSVLAVNNKIKKASKVHYSSSGVTEKSITTRSSENARETANKTDIMVHVVNKKFSSDSSSVISSHDFVVVDDSCYSVGTPESLYGASSQFPQTLLSSDDFAVELSRRSRFRHEFGRSIRPNHSFLHRNNIKICNSSYEGSRREPDKHYDTSHNSNIVLDGHSSLWYRHARFQTHRRTFSNFIASMKPGASSFLLPPHSILGCSKNNFSNTLHNESCEFIKRTGSASNIPALLLSDSEAESDVYSFNVFTDSKLHNLQSFHSPSIKRAVSVSSIAAVASRLAGCPNNPDRTRTSSSALAVGYKFKKVSKAHNFSPIFKEMQVTTRSKKMCDITNKTGVMLLDDKNLSSLFKPEAADKATELPCSQPPGRSSISPVHFFRTKRTLSIRNNRGKDLERNVAAAVIRNRHLLASNLCTIGDYEEAHLHGIPLQHSRSLPPSPQHSPPPSVKTRTDLLSNPFTALTDDSPESEECVLQLLRQCSLQDERLLLLARESAATFLKDTPPSTRKPRVAALLERVQARMDAEGHRRLELAKEEAAASDEDQRLLVRRRIDQCDTDTQSLALLTMLLFTALNLCQQYIEQETQEQSDFGTKLSSA